MDDPGVGRDDLEVVERALAPAQERVALLVALELELRVALERVGRSEHVDLDGVIDHELGGYERVDLVRVAFHLDDRVAHRGEVDDRRHAGEVLHHDPRGRERDLLGRIGLRIPGGERLDVLFADRLAVLVAQQVLEQDLEAERKPRDVELGLQRVEPVDLVGAVAHVECALGVEAVGLHVRSPGLSKKYLL